MSRLMDYDLKSIFAYLRTFTYTKEVDGQETQVVVNMFPSTQTDNMYLYFINKYGKLRADDIMENYKRGEISAMNLANIIETINIQKWKHYIEMANIEYNPIWNVDGKEVRTTETEYGKITTMEKGSSSTTEQLENAETVSEQITNGQSSNTHSVAPYDSTTFNPESKDESNTSIGKIKNTSDNGKVKTSLNGSDVDKNTGKDVVKDTFIRGGNIGVTQTVDLLRNEKSYWEMFDLFDMWFKSIVEPISIPLWED